MVQVKSYDFAVLGPCTVVGKSMRTMGLMAPYNPIPDFWEACWEDGTCERLIELTPYMPEEASGTGLVGYMVDYRRNEGFLYVIGILVRPGTPVPEGLEAYSLPPCTVARVWLEGDEPELYECAEPLANRVIEENGYRYAGGFLMEVYPEEGFGYFKPVEAGV